MNRIDTTFQKLRNNKEKALIAYITAGFPDLRTTENIIDELIQGGVNAVEIGVPFSDPVADGPVIQYASHQALLHDTNLADVLKLATRLRYKHQNTPLLFMGYMNPFYQYGIEHLAKRIDGLIDGIIIPDVPLEETDPVRSVFRHYNVHTIMLATPLTPQDRLKRLLKYSKGFLYAVSSMGVTGARRTVPYTTIRFIEKLRILTSQPIAIGIGISQPQQIRAIRSLIDGIIVGSAYIELIRDYTGKKRIQKIIEYTHQLKQALGGTYAG